RHSLPRRKGRLDAGLPHRGGSACRRKMKLRTTRTCRRDRTPLLVRALNFVGLRSPTRRCGDFLDEPPPAVGVREPRRPRPQAPGGAALLELPQTDLGWDP